MIVVQFVNQQQTCLELELELIEFREDLTLKNYYKCHSSVEFWQQVTECKYSELKRISIRLLSVFSTTYCCELLFSVMNFVKSQYRASLTNEHLREVIHTALTSYCPDFQKLTNKVELTVDLMLVKSRKNCKLCNVVFVFINFFY